MNKQEILDEINKTKEHLADLEKKLEECKDERWKPRNYELYFYINAVGEIQRTVNNRTKEFDNKVIDFYNCFQTKEEVEQEVEKILVRRMLENIARRLNKGQEIDWENVMQLKYFLMYNAEFGYITQGSMRSIKPQGVVSCLSDDFVSVAIQEIGEERLKKYLRGE